MEYKHRDVRVSTVAGAILLQADTNGDLHPCTYFSRTFLPADFFLGNKQRNSKHRGLLQTTALASMNRTLLARDDSLYLLDETVLVSLGVNR